MSGTEVRYCKCGCGEQVAFRRGRWSTWLPGHNTISPGIQYRVESAGYESDCWLWARAKDGTGYGRVADVTGRLVPAHRAFYERDVGPIPEGHQLDHLCRNRACVNPGHLEPVTNAENSRRGAMTKLTPEQVERIRTTNISMGVLAREMGVSGTAIWAARVGRTWVAK